MGKIQYLELYLEKKWEDRKNIAGLVQESSAGKTLLVAQQVYLEKKTSP